MAEEEEKNTLFLLIAKMLLNFPQDTVIALQALSEYAIQTSDDEVSLECTLTNDVDPSYRHSVTIHSGNALIQQSFKVRTREGASIVRVCHTNQWG